MKADNPIHGKESDELKKLYSKLIGRHNVLCAVEKVFEENKVANEYFERAREEVLDSGNQSFASMLVIAIENMAEYIADTEDGEVTDADILKMKLYELESENRKLKSKLDSISDFTVKTAIHS